MEDKESLKQFVREAVNEYIEKLELEQFAEDTAEIIVELTHRLEDLEEKCN